MVASIKYDVMIFDACVTSHNGCSRLSTLVLQICSIPLPCLRWSLLSALWSLSLIWPLISDLWWYEVYTWYHLSDRTPTYQVYAYVLYTLYSIRGCWGQGSQCGVLPRRFSAPFLFFFQIWSTEGFVIEIIAFSFDIYVHPFFASFVRWWRFSCYGVDK